MLYNYFQNGFLKALSSFSFLLQYETSFADKQEFNIYFKLRRQDLMHDDYLLFDVFLFQGLFCRHLLHNHFFFNMKMEVMASILIDGSNSNNIPNRCPEAKNCPGFKGQTIHSLVEHASVIVSQVNIWLPIH